MRETLFSGSREALLGTLQTAPLVDEINAVCSNNANSMYEALMGKVRQWGTGGYAMVQTQILWHIIAENIISGLAADPAVNSLKQFVTEINKSKANWFYVTISYDPWVFATPGWMHTGITLHASSGIIDTISDSHIIGRFHIDFNVKSVRLNEKFFTLLPMYLSLMKY